MKTIHILVSDEDYRALTEGARAARLKLGTWMRATLLKIAAVGAALLALGCGRALPEVPTDSATAAVDATYVRPDLAQQDLLAPAVPDLGLPCVSGPPNVCVYPMGTLGCIPGWCRGYPADSIDMAPACGTIDLPCCVLDNAGCTDGTVCCASNERCEPAASCR